MSAVALHDDGWAIRALPPGRRDLGCHELWDRSLARSRRRRAQAERRTGLPVRAVSAALLTTLIVVPAADLASAQDTTAGVASTDLRLGSKGPAVAAAQAALGVAADGDFGPHHPGGGAALPGRARARRRRRDRPDDARGAGRRRRRLGAGAGSVTMALQRALGVAADGDYGPITRAAVRAVPGHARPARRRDRRARRRSAPSACRRTSRSARAGRAAPARARRPPSRGSSSPPPGRSRASRTCGAGRGRTAGTAPG